MQSRTERIDQLFLEWNRGDDPRFHKDGIVDEDTYSRQRLGLLFVMLEGSAEDKGNRRYEGRDLREIYGNGEPSKTLTQNLARWTRVLLDGRIDDKRLSPEELARELRRIAVINLKKISGGAKARLRQIREHAFRDQEYLREQVRIIAPDLIVTTGADANAILGQVIAAEVDFRPPNDSVWNVDRYRVLPALHASHRKKTIVGVTRVATLARELDEKRF